MKLLYNDSLKKLIIQDAERIEYKQVKIWLERQVEGYRWKRHKYSKWDGFVRLFNNGEINVGLWKEIAKSLQIVGGSFEVINKHEFPINRDVTLEKVRDFCKEFFSNRKVFDEKTQTMIDFFPYDHQIETAYSILKNRYCTASVATSGGKTLIVSIVYFYILKHLNPNAKLLLITPSVSLVTQFTDEITIFNQGYYKENKNPIDIRIQEIMGDKPRLWLGDGEPNIYISTYQSMSKVENFGEDFYKSFYCVSVDEGQTIKTKSLETILNLTMSSATYRFGVSGTFPKDDSAEHIFITSLTGPSVTKIKAKQLQDLGLISKIKVKCVYLNHNNPELDDNLAIMRKNLNRAGEAYRIEGDFIRASSKRITFISKLIKNLDSNTLILFNILEYGERLKADLEAAIETYNQAGLTDLLSSPTAKKREYKLYYIDGSISKAKREEIKAEMEKNDGVVRILLATYGTLSTGVSIKNLHNLILAEGFKAESRIIQSLGRTLRLHHEKEFAIIYDIIDVFKETNNKNAYYRQGLKRQEMYREHEYPYTTIKFNL